MKGITGLVTLSLCALIGGAVLHGLTDSSDEVALATDPYPQPPSAVGGASGPPPALTPVPPAPVSAPPPPPVQQAAPTYPSLVITSCKGVWGSANLRAQPSLYGAILAVVPQGDSVLLLGGRAWGDGEGWIWVRTPNQQEGWIAACFDGG